MKPEICNIVVNPGSAGLQQPKILILFQIPANHCFVETNLLMFA